MNKILITASRDPYHNQALEACLLDSVEEDVILYLWQNERTVFIGKNQNAFAECDVDLLEEEGGKLARRTSGGGAVYHDLGNLNFTFLMKREDQDIEKEDSVILKALSSLGIEAERNGRNDLLVQGKKFSGHAYYKGKKAAYHHGTLMIDLNKEDAVKYLRPSKRKLEKKGVPSVRSRIIDLKEVKEDLAAEAMIKALIASFEDIYGEAVILKEEELDQEKIREWETFFSSPDRLYGDRRKKQYYRETLTEKGIVRLEYDREEEKILSPHFYTDSLDEEWAGQLSEDKEVWERLMREEEKCLM